jgi:hypothetical protein
MEAELPQPERSADIDVVSNEQSVVGIVHNFPFLPLKESICKGGWCTCISSNTILSQHSLPTQHFSHSIPS